MDLPALKHDYYGAIIHEASVGPRRELALILEIGFSDIRKFISIRFGGIENFDEVRGFFDNFASSPSRYEGLHFLGYSTELTSKPGKLHIEMQFDRTEDEVCISCRNISVSD